MESKKLRRGNIVKGYNAYGELIFTVNSVDEDKIAIGGWSEMTDKNELGRCYMKLKGIHEIDMTDEWAVKLGYKNLLQLTADINRKSKFNVIITLEDLQKMKLNEVQNLFFVLTGADLEAE